MQMNSRTTWACSGSKNLLRRSALSFHGTLLRRGFTKDSLEVGTKSWSTAISPKNGSPPANRRDLTLHNGQTLFLGSNSTDVPKEDNSK
jgi:hypothetical protein